MKLRYIFINILPFPIWLAYYILTLDRNKDLFLISADENILFCLLIIFTVYNFRSSDKVYQVFVKNLIFIISSVTACYISGQLYLEHCFHMSDEHYAVPSITFDYAVQFARIALVCCMVKFIINRIKSKKSDI